jgi:hypothetical protein
LRERELGASLMKTKTIGYIDVLWPELRLTDCVHLPSFLPCHEAFLGLAGDQLISVFELEKIDQFPPRAWEKKKKLATHFACLAQCGTEIVLILEAAAFVQG